MYTAHQVIPFVIEVNGTWDGFHPNYKKMRDKTVLRNRPGWQHLFTRLEGPSLQGRVNGKAFDTIRISKAGQAKVAQTYKINPDGSFYVILQAGNYDVSFEGSRSKKIQNLSVQTRQVMNF